MRVTQSFGITVQNHPLFMCSLTFLHPSPAFTFFDPNDPACLEILMDPRTTIPELFAIVRQWVPQVQHKIDVIGNEVSFLSYHLKQVNAEIRVSLFLNLCLHKQVSVRLQSTFILLSTTSWYKYKLETNAHEKQKQHK